MGIADLLRDAERGGSHVGDVPVEEGEGVGGVRGGGQEGDGEERRQGCHCSCSVGNGLGARGRRGRRISLPPCWFLCVLGSGGLAGS